MAHAKANERLAAPRENEAAAADERHLLTGRRSKKIAIESGARLAALRNQAGLSQAALQEAGGIPERTISLYEREVEAIPSTLVPTLA